MLDRQAIVRRHHPVLTHPHPLSPMSLGNGEFGFSADITGLQTFPEHYDVPLGTQSNWGWHYTGGRGKYTADDIRFQLFDTYGRQVPYPMFPEDREDAYHWLRQNPHRLQLGRIAFRLLKEDGSQAQIGDLADIRQELNLWEGILYSRFTLEGIPVSVQTCCHPEWDTIALRVESPLIQQGRLQLFVRFPAPDMQDTDWGGNLFPVWEQDDRHRTKVSFRDGQTAVFTRSMDEDGYEMIWHWEGEGTLETTGVHAFTFIPKPSDRLACTFSFAPANPRVVQPDEAFATSKGHWERFWRSGGAIDFAHCLDPRAAELERRVVLSQYLTAVHCSGSLPPQETGFMYNSWFGKFHLEMHWWHGAHFPLWGRASLLERSMGWYRSILPLARELAASQGYEGARWPKMVGPDGQQSPSKVAPGLIWQQPHPIAMAEMLYKANPSRETLERYRELVFESADFMVSYAHFDETTRTHVLGPPLIPAQECHLMEESMNPPYELEYWKYGLEIAVKWAERLGEPGNPRWAQVARSMSQPVAREGVYLAHANCPDTFTKKNHDHPSMVGALGILPGSLVNREIMRRTLLLVKEVWQWDTAWGWDFPMCAMTAARLGMGDLAIEFLLMDAVKNTYLPNGHNYQRPNLSAYLPGNGGLLTAVAMMAAGWEGADGRPNPGFPQDGKWHVKWEGLNPWL